MHCLLCTRYYPRPWDEVGELRTRSVLVLREYGEICRWVWWCLIGISLGQSFFVLLLHIVLCFVSGDAFSVAKIKILEGKNLASSISRAPAVDLWAAEGSVWFNLNHSHTVSVLGSAIVDILTSYYTDYSTCLGLQFCKIKKNRSVIDCS